MRKKPFTYFKEFFKEVSVAFILVAVFVLLLVVGFTILSIFPGNIWKDIPIEIIILVGFFTCLAVLYLISKIIDIVRKLKQKNIQENKQENE